MAEILIFGGTTEGRREALRLQAEGKAVTVSVTSAYAKSLLPENIDCHVGALDRDGMLTFIKESSPVLVKDATHPYAVRASENILACCRELDIPCQRIERPREAHPWQEDVWHVPDTRFCARALASTEGNVLLTTGSHTVKEYAAATDPARLWVRVLPTHAALTLCEEAGILPSHILAMQGPFSADLNAALYDQLNIAVMVTKDSGANGGVDEKVLPALARQIQVIMIDRPKENENAR
ncbi:MAG: precorrin-6A reductase [Clostridia bacterium]|nr:precorrin-6A reductase [Clostridia bacterium]